MGNESLNTPGEAKVGAEQAAFATDALYEANFEVLNPEAYKGFLDTLSVVTHGRTVGEFFIQLFVANPQEIEEDEILWIAIGYDFLVDGEDVKVQSKGIVVPTDKRDLLDIPELADTPTVVIQWADLDMEQVQAWGANYQL